MIACRKVYITGKDTKNKNVIIIIWNVVWNVFFRLIYVTMSPLSRVIPSFWQRVLLFAKQAAACKTLCGLTFRDSAELLYCNRRFNWTFMVPVSWGSLGSTLTVFVTSAGTLTTFPFIFSCFPLGACIIFWHANLGAISLHSSSFK